MVLKKTIYSMSILLSHAFVNPVSSLSDDISLGIMSSHQEICDSEELKILAGCAIEILSKLNECTPEDLACECCALQNMSNECYGLCPNTASGNYLAVITDDCKIIDDMDFCGVPFKNYNLQLPKTSRADMEPLLENKENEFDDPLILLKENSTLNFSIVNSFIDQKFDHVTTEDSIDRADHLNITSKSNSKPEQNHAISLILSIPILVRALILVIIDLDAFGLILNIILKV